MKENLGLFDWDEGAEYACEQIENLAKKYPSVRNRIKVRRYGSTESGRTLYGLQFVAEDILGEEYLTADTGVGFSTLQSMKRAIDRALKTIESGFGKIEYIK